MIHTRLSRGSSVNSLDSSSHPPQHPEDLLLSSPVYHRLSDDSVPAETPLVGRKHATPSSTTLNLSNTIVGAGSLALPYAFRSAGWLTGSFVLLLVAGMSLLSFMVLVVCSQRYGITTYQGLAEHALGPRGGRIARFFLLLYTFGSCSGYCVLIGDNFTEALRFWLPEGHLLLDRNFLIPICGLLLILMSLPRNLDPLKYPSMLAIVCILYVVFMCFIQMLTKIPDELGPGIRSVKGDSDIFLAFPLLVVAFTCHYNALQFYHELGPATETTVRTMSRVTMSSIGLCTTVYFLIAFGGYLMFGDDTKSNVLKSWTDGDDTWVLIAQLAMGLVLVFSFPLVHHALRSNLSDLLGLTVKLPNGELRTPNLPHVILTGIMSSLCVGLAVAVPDIGVVLGFNGSINGVMLVYVFPCLIYLKLMAPGGNGGNRRTGGRRGSRRDGRRMDGMDEEDFLDSETHEEYLTFGLGLPPSASKSVSSLTPDGSGGTEPRGMRIAVWFTLITGIAFGIIGVIMNIVDLV